MGVFDSLGTLATDVIGGNWGNLGTDLGGLAKSVITPDPTQGGATPIGNLLGLAAPLGGLYATMNAQSQAAKQLKMQKQAQQQAMQATAPLRTAGQALVQAGQTGMMGGALPANWEAEIARTKAQRMMQVRQMLANMGITDSTVAQQMEMQVDAEMLNLRNQIAGQLAGTGTGEIQAGVAPLSNVGASAGASAAQTMNIMQQAQAAMAKLSAFGQPTQPTQPTTAANKPTTPDTQDPYAGMP